MLAGSLEIQMMADMSGLMRDMQNAKRMTDDAMRSIGSSMESVSASISAMQAAEAQRASLFSRTMAETKRLFDITKGAVVENSKALSQLKQDYDGLTVPAKAMASLESWREKSAYALGAGMAMGIDKAKSAWDAFKGYTEKTVTIWAVSLATGIAAVALSAVYAAYKAIGFGVGLLTGESYKSANIDALVMMNREVKTLQQSLPLTAVGASALNEALKVQGISAASYAVTLGNVETASRKNGEELDRLGVKYKDQNGSILTTQQRLASAAAVLATYTDGWDRNQAAEAIGMGSQQDIQKALAVTAEKTQIAQDRLVAYGLIIGDGTQEAVAKYQESMSAFERESDLTSQGFKRAIADNIMPVLTDLADFFREGWPTAVMAFRYSFATITSLFYGLKTVVYIVSESVLGSLQAMGIGLGGIVSAIGKALTGDFSGAKTALVQGWVDAKARLGSIGDNIVAQARHDSAAMALAWGADSLGANAAAGAAVKVGKAWEKAKVSEKVKELTDEYKKLMMAISQYSAEQFAESNQTEKLTQGQKQALDIMVKLRDGTLDLKDIEGLSAEQKRINIGLALTQMLTNERANEDQKAALQAEIETAKFRNKLLEEEFEASEKVRLANEGQIKTARLMLDQIQDETSLLGMNTEQRALANAERELERQGIIAGTQAYDAYISKIRQATVAKSAAEELQAASKELDAFLDPTKAQTFGDALKGAFGGAADAMGKLTSVVQAYGIKQAQVDKARRDAGVKYASDAEGFAAANSKITAIETKDKLGAYGDMANAAKGFFDESSQGYKTLNGVAQAFHVAALAMQAVEMAQGAVAAVINQAKGDPYTAWARMAAMVAAMATLGYAVGGGFNSGGGGETAASRQDSQGRGTVLGDASEQSASLTNAMEALQENTFEQLKYSSGMLDALQSIQSAMAGLSQIIFRTAGITSGNTTGLPTGTLSKNNKDPLSNALGVNFFDDHVKSLPIIGKIASFVQGLWGKVTQEITDSGLSINGTLGQLASGQGVNQYTDVKRTESSWFGLVKKTTNSTITGELEATAAEQFGKMFKGISDSLQIAAVSFGADSEAIAAQLAASIVSIPAISLRDLKGQELQDALNAVFSGAADNLASTLIPGLQSLQKVGEGYFETLIRASTALTTVNGWLEIFGTQLITVSTEGAVAATSLADMFGGINELNAAYSGYYQDFYTEAEKTANTTAQVARVFEDLGLTMPDLTAGADAVREAFRAMVDTAMSDTTAAGQQTTVALLGVSGALGGLVQSAAEAATSVAKNGGNLGFSVGPNGRTILGAADAALYAADPGYAYMIDGLQGVTDMINASMAPGVSGGYGSNEDMAARFGMGGSNGNPMADSTKELLDAQNKLTAEQNKAWDAMRRFTDSLQDFLNLMNTTELGANSPEMRLAASRAEYERIYNEISAGDLSEQDKFTGAGRALLEASKSYNASGAGFVADEAFVRSTVGTVIAVNNAQLSSAEVVAQLKTLNEKMQVVERNTGMQVEVSQEGATQTVDQLKTSNAQQAQALSNARFESLANV